MAKENLCLENEQGTKHTEGEWEVRREGRQPSHTDLRTTGCRVFQEERAWLALLRAAGGQGLEASFETNELHRSAGLRKKFQESRSSGRFGAKKSRQAI